MFQGAGRHRQTGRQTDRQTLAAGSSLADGCWFLASGSSLVASDGRTTRTDEAVCLAAGKSSLWLVLEKSTVGVHHTKRPSVMTPDSKRNRLDQQIARCLASWSTPQGGHPDGAPEERARLTSSGFVFSLSCFMILLLDRKRACIPAWDEAQTEETWPPHTSDRDRARPERNR